MYRICFVFLFYCISLLPGHSQIKKIAEELGLTGTTAVEIEASPTVSGDNAGDSATIAALTEQIQVHKLNEILLQERLVHYEHEQQIDSLAIQMRRERIDSLRSVTPAVPVVVDGDTLFSFYAARSGNSAIARANNTKNMITALGNDWGVKPDSIYLFTLDSYIRIMYDDRVIMNVSEDDALWMNIPLEKLAHDYREKIVDTVKSLQEQNSLTSLVLRIVKFIGVLLALILIIKVLNYLKRRWRGYVKKYVERKFKPVSIRNFKILDEPQALKIMFFAIDIVRYLFILLALVIAVPVLFFIFPQTRDLAMTLFDYIITPVKSIAVSIIHYIPNLFTITIIWLLIHYVIKGLRYLSKEIGAERMKIPGFYADWAIPTFNLIRFFLYIFLIALIYPYLPGSNSGVFQGISVFVGLILSLGSTAVIGNIMAGLVITYMRPFKIGDMIKLNDTIGTVIEKTLFVTRIRTLKNEIITMPNSFMLSSQTTNYTASADSYGLIIHTMIGISYDIPNTRVHELLIKAARMTEGVLKDRDPFVLDKKFDDLVQQYEINAYITDVAAINRIYSQLHHHIQNLFIEAGIELQTPLMVSQVEQNAKS